MASPTPSPPLLTIPSGTPSQRASSPKSEPSKLPRGRKPGKSNKSPPKKKKPPQRGMGVERLERLRQVQERWGGAGTSLPEQVVAVAGLPPHPPLIPVAAGQAAYVTRSELTSQPPPSSSSFMVSPKAGVYGGSWSGGMLETSSKELSSIPKLTQCHHHHCDDSCCSKMGLIPSIINCHLLNGGLEVKGFNSRAMRQIYHQVNKEAEMMGITSQAASGPKEIEFFPSGKGVREYEFFSGTRAGLCTSSTSNAIDLSLKLSL